MKKLALLLLSCGLLSHAYAGEKEIRESLKKKFPLATQIDRIQKTPYSGLYEVVINDQALVYTDENGSFLIQGDIITDEKTNATEQRRQKIFAIDFNKLPFELATKKVIGNGKYKFVQFTDPNCGYCRKLEQEFTKLDDYTLYSFLLPLQPGSEAIARNVMCSKNPVQTWDNYMLRNVKPADVADCKFDFNKVRALASKYRINGTPGLIFSDGSLNPGYMPADKLEKRLKDVANDK